MDKNVKKERKKLDKFRATFKLKYFKKLFFKLSDRFIRIAPICLEVGLINDGFDALINKKKLQKNRRGK